MNLQRLNRQIIRNKNNLEVERPPPKKSQQSEKRGFSYCDVEEKKPRKPQEKIYWSDDGKITAIEEIEDVRESAESSAVLTWNVVKRVDENSAETPDASPLQNSQKSKEKDFSDSDLEEEPPINGGSESRHDNFDHYGLSTGEIEGGAPIEPSEVSTLDVVKRVDKNSAENAGSSLPKRSKSKTLENQSMDIMNNYLEEALLKEILADIDSHASEDYQLNEYQKTNSPMKSLQKECAYMRRGRKIPDSDAFEAPPTKKARRRDSGENDLWNSYVEEVETSEVGGRGSLNVYSDNGVIDLSRGMVATTEKLTEQSEVLKERLDNVASADSRKKSLAAQKVVRLPTSAHPIIRSQSKNSTRFTETRKGSIPQTLLRRQKSSISF